MPEFINIAAYRFVSLDRLADRKAALLPFCKSLDLKGTILLSHEGINLFLAGSRLSIDEFMNYLCRQPEFAGLEAKESVSDNQPFSRMLVRLKKEIISMGIQEIRPLKKTSPKISARELKSWLDEGRDVALLDVRNDYEVELGTFTNAIPIGIDHFRKFPEATDRLPGECRNKPIVMFCTGGIRCEKAGPLMEEKGFEQVYQLDGGILKYFEECGGEHYQGDCFVFDKRVAVDPNLQETDVEQCYGCQAILSLADQQSPLYDPPRKCPNCAPQNTQTMSQRLAQRAEQLHAATTPLPGCEPYENVRPMNVSAKFDNRPLLEFLQSLHVHLDADFWQTACAAERIRYRDQPLSVEATVRAGWRINHITPNTTEPVVSNDVKFLYEDEGLIAVHKPAPLPMHPCGRFNRNTLQYFLRMSYPNEQIRILHRLDAETTGVLILGRTREIAASIQRQFKIGEVDKIYRARVVGHPTWTTLVCDAAISDRAASTAGTRRIDPQGLAAITKFEVLQHYDDGTSLIACRPITGRTNQIRIHLAHSGYPIVGDSNYGTELAKGLQLEIGSLESSTKLNLHASEITFENPGKGKMTITAPSPKWEL